MSTERSRARAIIPTLFLDSFGDPASNPKGWAGCGAYGARDRRRCRGSSGYLPYRLR